MESYTESAIIQAAVEVDVSIDEGRQWFLELETHPERYQLDTHAGFVFVHGRFGEIGARFRTRERFCGLGVSLLFELTEVWESRFRFRLVRPALPIWGAFSVAPASADRAIVELAIGGTSVLGAWLLRLPLVGSVIRQQIRREVSHIRDSMEARYPSRHTKGRPSA